MVILLTALNRLGIQTTGYRPKLPATDLPLGAINGIDSVLWCYTFSAMLFTGALSGYLPMAATLLMVSCALIALVVAITSDFPVNVASLAEQAVVILAAISVTINNHLGEFSSID